MVSVLICFAFTHLIECSDVTQIPNFILSLSNSLFYQQKLILKFHFALSAIFDPQRETITGIYSHASHYSNNSIVKSSGIFKHYVTSWWRAPPIYSVKITPDAY